MDGPAERQGETSPVATSGRVKTKMFNFLLFIMSAQATPFQLSNYFCPRLKFQQKISSLPPNLYPPNPKMSPSTEKKNLDVSNLGVEHVWN